MTAYEKADPGPDIAAESPAGPLDQRIGWGSDVAAQMLRRLDIPYVALTPGASFRGLHDSIVNHLGNERPRIVLCLHEEHAVAIAQGYAKATGRAMTVALHSNVGLMHASMAIYNAWCDRQPMLIIGATGPLDAVQRRPWIDWVHTSQDQAALIRHFTKWDDQPGSVGAMPEAILRGWQIAATAPCGPVYVCLDAGLQERELEGEPDLPDPSRFRPVPPAVPDAGALDEAARLLERAERPLILYGRLRRGQAEWGRRVALAERLGAVMLSDLKAGSMVPSDHANHIGEPFNRPSDVVRQAIRDADVIASLGWLDVGGLLRQASDGTPVGATIIHAGQDIHLHRGWGKEHGILPPVDVHLAGDPDAAAAELLSRLGAGGPKPVWFTRDTPSDRAGGGAALTQRDVARALAEAAGDQPVTFAALPRGWPIGLAPHRDPLAFLGKDGGGGLGSGPGITTGAALALRDSGRLVVGVVGDGDMMMGISALWTAARYAIPALFIVANNRTYLNDEMHQENVARRRSRNPANRWVGQAIDAPAPDIAMLARAQGLAAAGPVTAREALADAMADAVGELRAGRPFVIDVHIDPR